MYLNKSLLASAIISAMSANALAEDQPVKSSNIMLEEVYVLSEPKSYANNVVSEEMKKSVNSITSVLAATNKIPGVLINEGDAFGGDDWSTTVSMRGFQLSLDEQQIGMMVDGIPNGGSNYGGGSKANRFIDTENLETVAVSQGTSDIASRSHEALGGSLNFRTQDPIHDARMRVSVTEGDHNAQKNYLRYDTGVLGDGKTRAYVSYSSSNVDSWIDESGEANRMHAAIKVISEQSFADITGYIAYDDTHEDNYQRVTTEEFKQNPDWDRLTGEWTGIPLVDQMYRRGWSTLRENTLAYVRFDFNKDGNLSGQVSPYYHNNTGRGDWVPQYIANVTDDGAGNPNSELVSGNTVYGGSNNGTFTYVNRVGVALTPATNCSSLTFPYGGSSNDGSNLNRDPACFPADAVPVSSYRHTHYDKERYGLTGDIEYKMDFDVLSNTLRGGFWWEDQMRDESRDWHKIIDSRTSYHFDYTPYWVQYDRSYPQTTTMLYVEDQINVAGLTARIGAKQWYVDVEREDQFAGASGAAKVSSDSDLLPSVGLQYQFTDSFDIFAGYAENFAAIKDVVLEAANLADNPNALKNIEPETAENIDLGLRFNSDLLSATLTFYDINFDNRITQLQEGGGEIDYLNEEAQEYRNMGGIESTGVEMSLTWRPLNSLSVYLAYTKNDSTYLGLDKDDILPLLPNGTDYDFDTHIAIEEANNIYRGNTVFGSVEDMVVLSLDWSQNVYSAGISTRYTGARWMDTTNEDRIPSYNVADLYVSVGDELNSGFAKGYEISLTVNNLFDKDYIGGVSGGWGGWLGAERITAINLKLDI